MTNSHLPMGTIASVTGPIVSKRTMCLPINASNHGLVEGHPSENIVQNHLNIALLVVKRYIYIRIFFSPNNFSPVQISLLKA